MLSKQSSFKLGYYLLIFLCRYWRLKLSKHLSNYSVNHRNWKSKMSRKRTESNCSQDANWCPPPPDHPHRLKRMESMSIQTYKPTIISDNRRMIEDLCRDLIVNNDHIHVVEQRLRASINQGLGRYESLYKSLWTVKKLFLRYHLFS